MKTAARPQWNKMSDPEQAAFLIDNLNAGHSYSHMTTIVICASRSALLGKKMRLEAKGYVFPVKSKAKRRFTTDPKPVSRAPAPKKLAAPAVKTVIAPAAKAAAAVIPQDQTYIPKADAFKPIPGVKPLPLADMPMRLRCRWPVDVPGQSEHFACGSATATDTHRYCAPHRQLSIKSAQPQGAM